MKHFYATIVSLALLLMSMQSTAADNRFRIPSKQHAIAQLAQRRAPHAKAKKSVQHAGLKAQKALPSLPSLTLVKNRPSYPKNLKAAGETIQITATNLSFTDWTSYGFDAYSFSASNNEYSVDLDFIDDAVLGYHSSEETCFLMGKCTNAQGKDSEVEGGSFTVDLAEDQKHYTLKGSITCEDGNTYILDFSYVKPTKSRSENISVTDGEVEDYRDLDGSYQATGYTADGKIFLSLCYYSDEVDGTFKMEDLDDYYTFVTEIEGTDSVYFDVVDGSFTATTEGDLITYKGTLLFQNENDPADVPEYTFTLVGKFVDEDDDDDDDDPVGKNLLECGDFEEWDSESAPTGWGGWQIGEKSNTGGATLEKSTDAHSGNFACIVKGASSNKRLSTDKMKLEEGIYEVSLYAKAVGETAAIKPGYATLQENGSANYNYGEFANAAVELTQNWQKVTYEISLLEDTELALLIMNYKNSGDCIVDDVTLTCTGGFYDDDDDEGLEYDEESVDFTYSFSASDVEIDDDYFQDYGFLFLDAETKDGYAVGLLFTLDEWDGNTIPAGTYEINGSIAPGTVVASDGLDDEGYINYSYAATIDDEGYPDKVWYMVSGTVKVEVVDGRNIITVDAKNSYGRSVKARIEGGAPQMDNLYYIDFTQGQGDWTIEDLELAEGVNYVWKQDKTYGMKASAYVNKKNTSAESWLISPLIDPQSENATLTISVEHALNYCSNHDEYMGFYFAPFDNPSKWQEIPLSEWPSGKDWNFVTSTATLSGVGKGYFAFQYTSDENVCGTWEIKNFSIATGATEVEMKSVVNSSLSTNENIYNLAGQRVGKDYKGIVVVNGKKILR